MPGRISILALGLLIAAAALGACDGGDDDDGLIATDRREDVTQQLTLEEIYDPSFTSEYPKVVAEVNGEPILGEDLAVGVAQQIASRWQYESGELEEQIGAMTDEVAERVEELLGVDPLEELIDKELLRQAAEDRGLMPSHEEAVAYTREEEERFLQPSPSRSIDDVFALLQGLEAVGYPQSDWASDREIVEMYRNRLGVTELRRVECSRTVATPGVVNLTVSTDCSDLLRQERQRADIVYYVRWAD